MKKCKYEFIYTPNKRCKENALEDNDFCIFHADFPKNEKKLEIEIDKKLSSADYDFEGCILNEIDLSDREINQKVLLNFFDATINGDFIFNGKSKGNKGKVEGLNFSLATVKGNIIISDLIIQHTLNFQNTKIDGAANFSNLEVNENAYFNSWGTHKFEVQKIAKFKNLEIRRNSSFKGSLFKESLDLSGSKFFGNFKFKKVKIYETLKFENVCIRGKANFSKSIFNGKVVFRGSRFYKITTFYGTKFVKNANFQSIGFKGMTNFKNTIFKEEINFNRASSSPSNKVIFDGCNLENIRFKDSDFSRCEFKFSKLPDRIIEDREYKEKKQNLIKELKIINNSILFSGYIKFQEYTKFPVFSQIIKDAEMIAKTYKKIENWLKDQDELDKANQFYFNEMEMNREIYAYKNKHKWIRYSIWWIISGYGVKRSRLLILIGLIMIIIPLFVNWQTYIGFIVGGIIAIMLSSFLSMLTKR